jgi:putative sigma-54 modulation protein
MLDVSIIARNIELTEWLQSYVETKIGKMDRYLPLLVSANVELTREPVQDANRRNRVQVTLSGARTIIRGEETAADMTAAVDSVVDILHRQIYRYKGRKMDRRSKVQPLAGGELPPLAPEVVEEMEEEQPARIVRVKHFTLEPMEEEDAVAQMEMLGHDFFVFFNTNAGRTNVVYRRRDGNYGLLDPDVQ